MLRRLNTTGARLATATTFALLAVLATVAAAAAFGGGGGTGRFAATFEARAGLPLIAPCPALGAGGQKIEGRYEGTLTVAAEEQQLPLRVSLEILVDRATGLGTAEGKWQLADPPGELADPPGELVARGELIAVVTTADPPDPDLELQGMLVGAADPPDPDLPAQRLLGNFGASLDERALSFTGAVGDPKVGDPTELTSNTAVLVPAVKC